jgi:hypothetical protein
MKLRVITTCVHKINDGIEGATFENMDLLPDMAAKVRTPNAILTEYEFACCLRMLGIEPVSRDDLTGIWNCPSKAAFGYVSVFPGYPAYLFRRNFLRREVPVTVPEEDPNAGYVALHDDREFLVHPGKYAECERLDSGVLKSLCGPLKRSVRLPDGMSVLRSYCWRDLYRGEMKRKLKRQGDTFLEGSGYLRDATTLVRLTPSDLDKVKEGLSVPCPDGSIHVGTGDLYFSQLWCAYEAGCFTRDDGTLIESIDELPELDLDRLRSEAALLSVPELRLPGTASGVGSIDVQWTVPGLLQRGGFSLTYGATGSGKTADVMRMLHRVADDCAVVYLNFEDGAGLIPRVEVLDAIYGRKKYFFPIDASNWDLCLEADWQEIEAAIDRLKSIHDPDGLLDWVVCIDNLNASIRSEERITKGPDTIRRHIAGFRGRTDMGVWIIAHANSKDEIWGANFLAQDVDVLTLIKSKNGARVHTREKGRNCESGVELHRFKLDVRDNAVFSRLEGEEVADRGASTTTGASLDENDRALTMVIDRSGPDGTLDDEALREVLDELLGNPGDTGSDAHRQRRNRRKKKLVADGVILAVENNRYAPGL